MSRLPLVPALLAVLATAACADPTPGPPLPSGDLGTSLDAGRGDALLLTFAAARARSSYAVDEGYSLAWDGDDVPAFTTPDAGDFGVALELDGYLYVSDDDYWLDPPAITHTASDSVAIRLQLDLFTWADVWFYAGSSGAATIDVRLTSKASFPRTFSVLPWVRRCAAPFTGVAASGDGLVAAHTVTPDPRLADAGPGTFAVDFADALAADQAPHIVLGAASCDPSGNAWNDLETMFDAESPPPQAAAQIALRIDHDLDPFATVEVRAHRAVADATQPGALQAALTAEKALDPATVLTAGAQRLSAIPPVPDLLPEEALAYRSSFALVDQVTMPATGRLAHDSYVFSRAPTWWSARLGQRTHESLAMILLARLDPAEAAETHRNFIDHVGADGYLPLGIGPVVDEAPNGAAATPLFSFTAWEIAQRASDPAFLADAYAAGVKLHGFWTAQRDQDQDGLSEWGSLDEAPRGANDVIFSAVAPANEVESVDLNAMLVMEEKALASMATALGDTAGATQWTSAATARAALINARMWDSETGFYYPISLVGHDFTYTSPNDLRRMDIGGLLPLWAGIVPADRLPVLLAKLGNSGPFLQEYGVASLSASDPSFMGDATGPDLWNGPVWVPWQWLLVRGLRGYGETALADRITERTMAAVVAQLQTSGQFWQLYATDDQSAPNGSYPNYLWSALAALMVLEGTGT